MIKINKREEPVWLRTYKKQNPRKVYKNLDGIQRSLLRGELLEEQYYLCGYCCTRLLMDKAINEHILPQSMSDTMSLDYNNLIASCSGYKNNQETCGHRKENTYDALKFIGPLEDGCESNFQYYPNGEIVPVNERADYTIKTLNLNSYELKKARKAIFKQLVNYSKDMIVQIFLTVDDGMLQPFCNVAKWYTQSYE